MGMAKSSILQLDDDDDPFAKALLPPADETDDARQRRVMSMQEAQRISRGIDESLQEAKRVMDKKKKATTVLLLGQSESGKSSVLKNFQIAFTPKQFQSEKSAWTTVIQLNIIGSIKKILEVLDVEWASERPVSPIPPRSPPSLATKYRRIRLGLSPLLAIEANLNRLLLPENNNPAHSREICVQAGRGWKGVLQKATSVAGFSPERRRSGNQMKGSDDPTAVLAACREDIISLWEDPEVQEVLSKHHVRLEETSGFFLNDMNRIAVPGYVPTDSDVIRARLRTMGVEEYQFTMEIGSGAGYEWLIYDVGGSRTMRQQWIPFFDNVHAIFFVAPLSFNQVLEEDKKVNRLEDSLALWKQICANKLLSQAAIILFLNKMDILEKSMASGMVVKKYVPSYEGPNDADHVMRYFKEKFRAYHKRLSIKPRPFTCHPTSAIDTNATSTLLVEVRDGIIYSNLQKLDII